MSDRRTSQIMAAVVVYIIIQITSSAGGLGTGADERGVIAPDTARTVARQHLLRGDAPSGLAVGDATPICDPETGTVLCYGFELLPQGYVVVCAARALPPVIAYSYNSDAGCDFASDNPLVDLLTWDLHQRLEYAESLPSDDQERSAAWADYLSDGGPARGERGFEQWPPAGSTPTGGWLLTNWTQNSPYNDLCPLDLAHGGGRSLAGCPAVAMAQIVNYHARLNGTYFTDADDYYHNYNGNQFWIDDAYIARGFPSWPQLDAYLQTVFDSYFYGTTLSNASKAALTYACGAAAHQVYGASGSGTFAVAQAYQAFEKFGCTTAVLLDASEPKLDALLSDNMMNAFPAHLAVVNESWTSGHNLVVDGYNTDGYYHLNFGWGGSYNGWYLLPSGLPYGLTVIEGVIINIMTDGCRRFDCTCDGLINLTDFTYLTACLHGPGVAPGATGYTAFDANADGDVDLADFSGFQAAFGT